MSTSAAPRPRSVADFPRISARPPQSRPFTPAFPPEESMSAPALDVRLVAYTDPLVLPLLAELDHEYSTRYGHTLGDLRQEMLRGSGEFGPPDGGLLLLLDDGEPVAGGAFRRY